MSLTLRYALSGDSADLGTDSSGSGLHMSNTGVATFDDPAYGGVGGFDGASYLGLASASVPSTATGSATRCFSVWVNPAAAARTLYSSGDESASGGLFRVSMNASRQVTLEYSTLAESAAATALDLWAWSHVVVMYDGARAQCYVNGSLEFDDARALQTTETDLSVGRDSSQVAASYFDGYMSDFRLYNNHLNESDVSDLHARGPNEVFNLGVTALAVFGDEGLQADVVDNDGVVAVGNVTTRGLTLLAEKQPSGDTEVESSVYLHDDATSERVLISKKLHTVDEGTTSCLATLQLGSVDDSDTGVVQDCIQYSGEAVAIHSVSSTGGDNTTTVNFDGLSFDSDAASVVLGPLSEFRIRYDDATDTVQIQHLDGAEYVTKVEYGR